LKLNPDLAYIRNNLGYSYFLQKNYDAAITEFRAAVSRDEQNKKFHNNLGLAYAHKGFYDLALEAFRKAGGEASAHHNLAQVYYQKGQYDLAKIHFAQASKAASSVPETQKGFQAATALAEITGADRDDRSSADESPAPYYIEIDDKGRKKIWFKINRESATVARPERPKDHSIVVVSGQETIAPILNLDIENNDKDRSEYFEIEVSNGNGVRRMARRVGNYLQHKGLNVTRLTNADNFEFSGTTIYYQKKYLEDAFKIAQQIPGYQDMEKVDELNPQNIKIKLLIGKDLVPYDGIFSKDAKES